MSISSTNYGWNALPAVSHSHSFITTSPPKREESTADKVARERREAQERAALEAAYAAYDELDLSLLDPGTVVRFDVDHGRDHLYTYAALFVDNRWFLTGSALNGGSTEDFLAWLIRHDVPAAALVLLEGRDE